MISVILYGRNDSYGYNLHKRAALSLNCIAELLDAPGDEILFVDYNTPDDYPTFPEAIRDTLTPRARRLLRILRVRPAQHRRFAALSHLVALEPVARNVAVRRSNPANRWLLSTNTDMIFVPRTGRSLSAIAAPLADGYYHLARCEIPESLWETLDRTDPAGCIAAVGDWGWRFHLNELTDHELPCIRFDAPGDFQLVLRSDAHRIWGFDERMLLGYHVDTNIAARLHLLYGRCDDVEADLFGYHCDHTRQVTPAHRHDSPQNDPQRFIFDIADAFDARPQADTWGLADADIEEVRLDGGRATYLDALLRSAAPPMQAPSRTLLGQPTYEKTDYHPAHVMPFMLDALVEYPRTTVLGWFGTRPDLLAMFATAWRALGFTAPIQVSQAAPWLGPDLPEGCTWTDPQAIVWGADTVVLDAGVPAVVAPGVPAPHTPEVLHVMYALRELATAERARRQPAGTAPPSEPRRIVAVNAFLNSWELLVRDHVAAAKSPGSTRVRQGFVIPTPPAGPDILARIWPAAEFHATDALPGLLAALASHPPDQPLGWFGARRDLLKLFAAAWRALGATAKLLVPREAAWLGAPLPEGCGWADLQAVARDCHAFVLDAGVPPGIDPYAPQPDPDALAHVVRAQQAIAAAEYRRAAPPRRILLVNGLDSAWDHIAFDPAADGRPPEAPRLRQGVPVALAPAPVDILGGLVAATAGERVRGAIRIRPFARGLVFGGPYLDLPPGDYRVRLTFEPERLPLPRPGPMKLEVTQDQVSIGHRIVAVSGLRDCTLSIDFTLPAGSPGAAACGFELRLATIGAVAGRFTAATLLADPAGG